MKTFQACSKFLHDAGMVTVFAWKSGHFSSLLEAAGGRLDGNDPGFQRIWRWKDELPAHKVAWAGRLIGTQVLLVHARLLPALLGWRGPLDIEEHYQDGLLAQPAYQLYQALNGSKEAVGRRELRRQLNFTAPTFDKACRDLERLLVITRAASDPQPQGWDSNSYALVDRHFADVKPLPRKQAEQELRAAFAHAAPAASPAQVSRWMRAIG